MTEKRLVALKTFDTSVEAELFRNALRAQGIRAELAGPDSSSTFGAYFGALGRVSVMVTEEAARRLAVDARDAAPAEGMPARKTCHSLQPYTPMRIPAAHRDRFG